MLGFVSMKISDFLTMYETQFLLKLFAVLCVWYQTGKKDFSHHQMGHYHSTMDVSQTKQHHKCLTTQILCPSSPSHDTSAKPYIKWLTIINQFWTCPKSHSLFCLNSIRDVSLVYCRRVLIHTTYFSYSLQNHPHQSTVVDVSLTMPPIHYTGHKTPSQTSVNY